eukprot:COSAG06_NODE_1896_length_8121_cov_3.278733_4_plen_81_part_00
MVVTAWNGGGDHHFTRVQFEPTLERHSRDALHFSDQRIGPTFIDCTIGYTGADLRLSPPRQFVLKPENLPRQARGKHQTR